MKTLMYPIAPEDDFPDEFCAIRQGSGEHMFYKPVGEFASQMPFASRVESENAQLRKLLLDVWNDAMQFDGFWDYVNDDGEIYNEDELPHYKERMRELGIEVPQ